MRSNWLQKTRNALGWRLKILSKVISNGRPHFLLVKVTVRTTHRHIHDAIQELQSKTALQVGSTRNVKVLKTEIMQLKTRTH